MAGIDLASILKRKAEIDFATPDNPTTIRDSNLNLLQMVDLERYNEIMNKVKTGACIVVSA